MLNRKSDIQCLMAKCLTAAVLLLAASGCVRKPDLYLHHGEHIDIDIPVIDLGLEVYWDYEFSYGITYDWTAEWVYGWDAFDYQVFGEIGYTQPKVFDLRRYHTNWTRYAPHTSVKASTIHSTHFNGEYDWGFWDILVWNDIETSDGVQSINIDEETTLDSVFAYTNQTMHASRYQAPQHTRSFYEPEPLFSAYHQGLEINQQLDGFVFDPERNVWVKKLNMMLEPVTFIYLTQVILHNNKGRITGVDGAANLSGMARSVNVNNGITGRDPVTVFYNVRFKPNCNKDGESVDVAGGRLMTFGMCGMNPNRITRSGEEWDINDKSKHYMDLNMQFNNGMDSTFVFDVTQQVRKLYKGGVITIELDMDTIPTPVRPGGSAFSAVVLDYEDGGSFEIEM